MGDVPEGHGRTFTAGDRAIGLFRVEGKYYALDDYCSHAGASLGEGNLCGDVVICRQHRWS